MTAATTASTLNRRLGLVFTGVALGLAWAVVRALRPDQIEVATLFIAAGTLVIALPILRDTLAGIRGSGFEAPRFYMDQFITLAVAACFATGRFVTGGVVALILVVGQILEERSVLGVREAVESLLKLSRVKARRLRGSAEESVDAEQLAVGDRVRVLPGETIPADGNVLTGASAVNQAHITGESLPVEVEPGGPVFGADGKLVGFGAIILPGDDDMDVNSFREIYGRTGPLILPTGEIKSATDRAKEIAAKVPAEEPTPAATPAAETPAEAPKEEPAP